MATIEVIVIMKLLAGRTQDLADVEAIIDSGADREHLKAAVGKAAPGSTETLEACSPTSTARGEERLPQIVHGGRSFGAKAK